MMSFGIDQVNFRDLFRQVLFVGYSLREPLAAAGGVADLPEDADGMLAYGYIDPDAGLSFEALAPARMSDLTVYPEFRPHAQAQVRYEGGRRGRGVALAVRGSRQNRSPRADSRAHIWVRMGEPAPARPRRAAIPALLAASPRSPGRTVP